MAEIKELIMPIDQYSREGWSSPSAVVSATETLLEASATTMKNANIPADAYQPRESQKTVEIAFVLGADAQEVTCTIYAARTGGDIAKVYICDVVAGKQAATNLGQGAGFYGDTIDTATDTWISTVNLTDEGGNDRMARISFDTHGYRYIWCAFTAISSESVYPIYSGY